MERLHGEQDDRDQASGSDLNSWLAAAADLCLKPWRHAVVPLEIPGAEGDEVNVRIEARSPEGTRQPEHDLELEIYRSGAQINVMLTLINCREAPVLWHGGHPVWMRPGDGERCDGPDQGAPLEAFCRRIRALLSSEFRSD